MQINSCNNTSFSGIRVVMNNREQKNFARAMGTIRSINAIFKPQILVINDMYYGIFSNHNIREELLIEKMLKKNDVKYDIFLPITEAVPENKYHWILTGIPINSIKQKFKYLQLSNKAIREGLRKEIFSNKYKIERFEEEKNEIRLLKEKMKNKKNHDLLC